MWEIASDDDAFAHLTHEMPCPRCGHPPHLFLRVRATAATASPDGGCRGDRLTG